MMIIGNAALLLRCLDCFLNILFFVEVQYKNHAYNKWHYDIETSSYISKKHFIMSASE